MAEIPSSNSEIYHKTAETLANRLKQENERSTQMEVIVVYVCPVCKSYYGASGVNNLESQENLGPATDMSGNEVKDRSRGFRNECPDCKTRGKTVKRVKRWARLVPIEEANLAIREINKKLKS